MSDRSTKDASSSKRERSHRNGNSTRLFAAAKAREAEARIVVLKKKLEALQEKHRLEEESAEKRLKEVNEKRRREIEETAQRERQKRHDIELWNELEEEARQESLAKEERRKIKEEERIDAILRMYPKCMVPKWHSFVADFDVKYCKFPSLRDFTAFMKNEEAEIDREGATSPEAEIDQEDVSSPEVQKDAAPEEKEPAIEERKTPPVVEALAREDGKKEDPVPEMLVPVESTLVHEKFKNEDPTQEKLVVEDDFKEESIKVAEQPFERMTDDRDESYDRPMSLGLRSRSPPHRARLKMPNEDKVDGLCIPRGADAQKDFGRLTRNVKLTTQQAAARGAPKTAEQKTFFMTRGERRAGRKRDMTLRTTATRRYVKNKDFKTGRCKAGRPPDRNVEPRGAKKSYRREPQEVRKKTPKALQKAVRRARRCEYKKVYKDLKGKFKKLRSSVKKSSEVLLCGRPP